MENIAQQLTRSAASSAVVRPTRSTTSSRPMIARDTVASVASSTRSGGAGVAAGDTLYRLDANEANPTRPAPPLPLPLAAPLAVTPAAPSPPADAVSGEAASQTVGGSGEKEAEAKAHDACRSLKYAASSAVGSAASEPCGMRQPSRFKAAQPSKLLNIQVLA